MQQAIHGGVSGVTGSVSDLPRWVKLPGLCCQAAGGDPLFTDNIAATWLLFYKAAHIIDNIQDRDTPEPWWETAGPGVALAAATGLYFTASSMLNQLPGQRLSPSVASQITRDFNTSFLGISGGQFKDLHGQVQSLKQYWQIASAKSGVFFALACRSGSRLATRKAGRIEAYGQYGEQLGLLIQISDDVEEFQNIGHSDRVIKMDRSLPVIYTLEVSVEPAHSCLYDCLKSAPGDEQAAREALRLVEQSGAALYVATELERHRILALRALEKAGAISPAREELVSLVSI